MKLLVVAAILGACAAARLDKAYLPPRGNDGAGYGGSFAAAAGGSGFQSAGGFGQGGAGFGQGGAGFGQGGAGFGQGGAGFGQSAGAGAGFGRGSGFGHGSGSGFGQGGGAGFGQGGGAGFGQGAGAGFGQGAGHGAQYTGNGYSAPAQQYSSRQQASQDAGAQILRLNNEVNADGFAYDFETSNGIRADAQGVATNGVQSQGSFGYKGDDGQDYSITYTADENGFQPRGAHLPTPPPIPEEILKSLEQNARDEAAGISDDGSYQGEGGAGAGGFNQAYSGPSGSGPSSQYGAPSRGFAPRPSNFGSSSASRQYLAPKAGPGGPGSGSFNPQSGYQY